MRFTFRPIITWPRPFTKNRKRSPFAATFNRTIQDLERELAHLKASGVVVQLAVAENEIRLDGLPYANAKPRHPGVILSFRTPNGPLSYPCDTYFDWTQNLRAIALSLAALRAVNRYGVSTHGEQYQGWKQLPPGEASAPAGAPPAMTLEDAARYINNLAGRTLAASDLIYHKEIFRTAYRVACTKVHPDTNGGQERPEWHRLQKANGVLEQHHGV